MNLRKYKKGFRRMLSSLAIGSLLWGSLPFNLMTVEAVDEIGSPFIGLRDFRGQTHFVQIYEPLKIKGLFYVSGDTYKADSGSARFYKIDPSTGDYIFNLRAVGYDGRHSKSYSSYVKVLKDFSSVEYIKGSSVIVGEDNSNQLTSYEGNGIYSRYYNPKGHTWYHCYKFQKGLDSPTGILAGSEIRTTFPIKLGFNKITDYPKVTAGLESGEGFLFNLKGEVGKEFYDKYLPGFDPEADADISGLESEANLYKYLTEGSYRRDPSDSRIYQRFKRNISNRALLGLHTVGDPNDDRYYSPEGFVVPIRGELFYIFPWDSSRKFYTDETHPLEGSVYEDWYGDMRRMYEWWPSYAFSGIGFGDSRYMEGDYTKGKFIVFKITSKGLKFYGKSPEINIAYADSNTERMRKRYLFDHYNLSKYEFFYDSKGTLYGRGPDGSGESNKDIMYKFKGKFPWDGVEAVSSLKGNVRDIRITPNHYFDKIGNAISLEKTTSPMGEVFSVRSSGINTPGSNNYTVSSFDPSVDFYFRYDPSGTFIQGDREGINVQVASMSFNWKDSSVYQRNNVYTAGRNITKINSDDVYTQWNSTSDGSLRLAATGLDDWGTNNTLRYCYYYLNRVSFIPTDPIKYDTAPPSLLLSMKSNKDIWAQKQVANISATDNVGIDSIQYALTNSSTRPSNGWINCGVGDLSITRQGSSYLHVLVKDGNKNEAYKVLGPIKVDRTGASISTDIGSQTTWKKGNQKVRITLADPESGIREMKWAVDTFSGDPASYPSSTTASVKDVYITQEGRQYLHVWAKNHAGVISRKTFGPYQIDNSPPSRAILNVDKTVSKDRITISVVPGSDTLSGYKETLVRATGADGFGYRKYTGPFQIDGEGTTYVYARSVDNAGNYSSAFEEQTKTKLIIDKTPPSSPSISVDKSITPSGWYKGPIKITLSGASDNIELDGLFYDAAGILVASNTKYSNPINVLSSGIIDLTAIARDKVGWSASTKKTFKVDSTPPADYTLSSPNITENKIRVNCNGAVDEHSGLADSPYAFKINTESWHSYKSDNFYEFADLSPNTPYVIYCRVIDRVGNYKQRDISFRTKAKIPSITVTSKSEGLVNLSIDPKGNPIGTEYTVYRKDLKTGVSEQVRDWNASVSVTDLGVSLISGIEYYVKARNGDGAETSFSDPVTVYDANVEAIEITSESGESISLAKGESRTLIFKLTPELEYVKGMEASTDSSVFTIDSQVEDLYSLTVTVTAKNEGYGNLSIVSKVNPLKSLSVGISVKELPDIGLSQGGSSVTILRNSIAFLNPDKPVNITLDGKVSGIDILEVSIKDPEKLLYKSTPNKVTDVGKVSQGVLIIKLLNSSGTMVEKRFICITDMSSILLPTFDSLGNLTVKVVLPDLTKFGESLSTLDYSSISSVIFGSDDIVRVLGAGDKVLSKSSSNTTYEGKLDEVSDYLLGEVRFSDGSIFRDTWDLRNSDLNISLKDSISNKEYSPETLVSIGDRQFLITKDTVGSKDISYLKTLGNVKWYKFKEENITSEFDFIEFSKNPTGDYDVMDLNSYRSNFIDSSGDFRIYAIYISNLSSYVFAELSTSFVSAKDFEKVFLESSQRFKIGMESLEDVFNNKLASFGALKILSGSDYILRGIETSTKVSIYSENRFRCYTKDLELVVEDSLPSNITGLVEGKNGELLASTSTGIYNILTGDLVKEGNFNDIVYYWNGFVVATPDAIYQFSDSWEQVSKIDTPSEVIDLTLAGNLLLASPGDDSVYVIE